MNLRVADARGQCYDGAATMAGEISGVATQLEALHHKMLFTQLLWACFEFGYKGSLLRDTSFKINL